METLCLWDAVSLGLMPFWSSAICSYARCPLFLLRVRFVTSWLWSLCCPHWVEQAPVFSHSALQARQAFVTLFAVLSPIKAQPRCVLSGQPSSLIIIWRGCFFEGALCECVWSSTGLDLEGKCIQRCVQDLQVRVRIFHVGFIRMRYSKLLGLRLFVWISVWTDGGLLSGTGRGAKELIAAYSDKNVKNNATPPLPPHPHPLLNAAAASLHTQTTSPYSGLAAVDSWSVTSLLNRPLHHHPDTQGHRASTRRRGNCIPAEEFGGIEEADAFDFHRIFLRSQSDFSLFHSGGLWPV